MPTAYRNVSCREHLEGSSKLTVTVLVISLIAIIRHLVGLAASSERQSPTRIPDKSTAANCTTQASRYPETPVILTTTLGGSASLNTVKLGILLHFTSSVVSPGCPCLTVKDFNESV